METHPSVSQGLHLLPKILKTVVEGGMELRVQTVLGTKPDDAVCELRPWSRHLHARKLSFLTGKIKAIIVTTPDCRQDSKRSGLKAVSIEAGREQVFRKSSCHYY